ncbi:M3 family oligoendopeptidase [Lysinibacillus sp. 54212]|uniref:M3 family oligoendopeptidase n=1 Tax=Lysinibacillus sp. 54212 TaxID=3119829 RepID=UPI002FC8B37A
MTTRKYSEVWDLDVFFEGGSESAEFEAFIDALPEKVESFFSYLKSLQQPVSVTQITKALNIMKDVLVEISHAGGMLSCLTAQNTKDTKALLLQNKLSSIGASFAPATLRFQQILAEIKEAEFIQLLEEAELKKFSFILTEWREQAKQKLSEDEEALISALSVDGYSAWGQMYNLLIGDIKVEVDVDGDLQILSIGQANNLSAHQNATVRKNAFEAIEKVFTEKEEFFAKTLNHLAGFRLTTYKKRGWNEVLQEPLQVNRMKKETLDAMWGAIANNKEPFVRFLKIKAGMLGKEKMDWYDLNAPIVGKAPKMSYQEGAEFILKHFGTFGPKLEAFARTAFENEWIEAEDRPNKRPGGFCTGLPVANQSRIFMTYSGTLSNVSTLAHELGHAFHSYALRPVDVLNRRYAMNVAETASTFAETIIADAAIGEVTTKGEKLNLLESKLQRSVAFFMDIHARFLFETRFYEERKKGVVSSQRLNELMEEAQHEAFAGALEETHPHFWASKLHFYITGVPFYNFPYTFGYLFSLSIYGKAQEEGNAFEEKYISLLQDTAVMSVEDLALKHLGEDITKQEFWEKGIALCIKDVEEFIRLTAEEG